MSVDHAGVTKISHAEHQSRHAIVPANNDRVAEENAGGRAREAHEDQTRNDRNPDHAEEDFQGGNEVTIKGGRIHVPVADGGQGLCAEEKRLREGAGGHFSDTGATHGIESGKAEVEQQIASHQEERKSRPGQGEHPMIPIAPILPRSIDFKKFDAPGADWNSGTISRHALLDYRMTIECREREPDTPGCSLE